MQRMNESKAAVSKRYACFVAALFMLLPAVSQAVDYYWNAANGSFDVLGNWTACPPGTCVPTVLPGAADSINFELLDATVNFTTGGVAAFLRVRGTNTLLDFNGATYNIAANVEIGQSSLYNTSTSSSLSVTDGGLTSNNTYTGFESGHTGILNINGGGSVTDFFGIIGHTTGSMGGVTVDGVGSSWTNFDNLLVGNAGNGTLEITNGGSVLNQFGLVGQLAGSTGSVTVDGANSSWTNTDNLLIGNAGNGTLAVSNGGKVLDKSGYLGFAAATEGSATIDGPNSDWSNTDNLFIGYLGNGTLAITQGGSVLNFQGFIGYAAGSAGNATVDGTDSTWTNAQDMFVGYSGNGTLAVSNGGSVLSQTTGYIGYNVGSQGVVSVDGPDTTWTMFDDLHVGESGSGSLAITNGARVVSENGFIGKGQFGAGDVTVDGNESVWKNTVGMIVGDGGSGSLSITKGGRVNSLGAIIGDNGSSTGAVTVDGLGSGITIFSDLIVGNFGSGTLDITNSGALSSGASAIGGASPGIGEVTVDGTLSTWFVNGNLVVGNDGSGMLAISNGGRVSSSTAGDVFIGSLAGSSGHVSVDGVGSSLVVAPLNSYLAVGAAGSGSLNITNGGSVSTLTTIVGQHVGGEGNVNIDGALSTWVVSGVLVVGNDGSGSLNITNGGSVSTLTTGVGEHVGGEGNVTIDGVGSSLTASVNFFVGFGGSGSLNITNGGSVTVGDRLFIGNNIGTGMVNLTGGTLDAATVDSSFGTFTMSGGTLNADNFIGDLTNAGGTVGPGRSAGLLTVEGDYSQDALSTLLIEIGGLLAGSEYDVLDVTGTANLGGTLDVDWFDLGGGLFSASAGDSFDILSAETILGEFDLLTLALLGDGLEWGVSYIFDDFGKDFVRLNVVATSAVPVPAAIWLFGSGLIGLIGIARRKKR